MNIDSLLSSLLKTTLGYFLKLILGALTDLFFGGAEEEKPV